MRRFGGHPALNQLAICIADFQLCTGQFFAVGDILLGNVHRSAQIGICAIHYLPCYFLTGIGKLDLDGSAVQQIPCGSSNLYNTVFATITGIGVGFCADGYIYVKPCKAIFIGRITGCQLCACIQQLRAICCENIVHRVQFIHSTGQIGQRFAVLLIDTNANFADLVAGLFGGRQNAGILKHKGLCGLMGIRSVLDIDDAVRALFVAILLVADDGFRQHNIIALVVPAEFYRVALPGQHKTIRRFDLGDSVLAQGQGHGHFALGAVMGDGKEIVGSLCTIGGKFCLIDLTGRTRGNGGNKVAIFIPISTLTVWRGNIAVRMDFIHSTGKVILRIDELAVFVVCQHIAQLADSQLSEGFVVEILFFHNVLVHVVGGVAHNLPDTLGSDFKFYGVGRIIVVAFGTLQFLDQIAAKRQFFRRFHQAIRIGVEHIGFLGGAAAGRINHRNAGLVAFIIQLVQRKRDVRNLDRLAGFGIGLDKLQVTFQFFIQHVIGHVVVGGGGDATCRNRKTALRAVLADRYDKGITLEHIFRNRGLDNKVLSIRKSLNTDDAFLVRIQFCQPVLCILIGRNPAIALAVGVIAICSQGGIVGFYRGGVALIHIGNSLSFGGEIVLERQIVVVIFAVSIQNTLCIVAAIRVFSELRFLAQLGNAVDGEARTLQLQRRAGLTGGGDQLIQREAGFEDFILAFLFSVDVVAGFICIGQRFVVVDLIAEIPGGIGKVIPIPCLAAIQLAAFSYGRVLIFIDVVGVLVILPNQITVLAGALQLLIQLRVFAGRIQFAVAVNRQHQTCRTLHEVVAPHIQVGKSKFPVLNSSRGNQPVFLQNGQVIRIPAAVGKYGSVPDGVAVGIQNFGIIHCAGDAIRVCDGIRCIQVIDGSLQGGITVAARSQIPRCVQIDFGQQNTAENAVVLHLIGIGVHGVGFFIVCDTGRISVVSLVSCAIAKRNRDDTLAGVDQRAAVVGGGNIGIIVCIAEPKSLPIQRLGDFKGIGPLAQNGTCRTGVRYIRPVAIVATGGTALHNHKTALVALSIVDVIRTVGIAAVVDDFIGAVRLTFHRILVIAACGDIALEDGIPFINLERCITLDALFGFAVDFVDADLDGPLVVFHEVVVAAVGGNRDGLAAAKVAAESIKAVGHRHLVVGEFQVVKVVMGSRKCSFDFAIDLTFAGALCSRLRGRCLCISVLLTVSRNAAALGSRLADAEMHRPCCRTIAAVQVVIVICRMTAGRDGLHPIRRDRPAAAVNVGRDAIKDRCNLNACAVHFLQCVQLDFVGIDRVGKIQGFAALIAGAPRLIHRFTTGFKTGDLAVTTKHNRGIIQNHKALPCSIAGRIQRTHIHGLAGRCCIGFRCIDDLGSNAVGILLCLPRQQCKVIVCCVIRCI